MKILLVSTCTKKKFYEPKNKLTFDDYDENMHFKSERCKELEKYKKKAIEMYTGKQYGKIGKGPVCQALDLLRRTYKNDDVDLHIISPGYGLINENDEIYPYDITFQGSGKKEILEHGNKLDITNKLNKLVAEYDIIFILVSRDYLASINHPLNLGDNRVCYIFSNDKGYKDLYNNKSNFRIVNYTTTGVGKLEALPRAMLKLINSIVNNYPNEFPTSQDIDNFVDFLK